MPIMTDSTQKFKIVLDSDKGKENPPAFIFKAVSLAKLREINDVLDNLKIVKNDNKSITSLLGCIEKHLCGWENMIDPSNNNPLDFDFSRIEDILTMTEMFEIITKMKWQGLESNDLKN